MLTYIHQIQGGFKMTEKEVIRKVMNLKGWSQSMLAKKAGFKNQSNITGLLNNNKNGIRIDNLFKIFTALGCEIVIRDIKENEQEWVIDMKSDTESPISEENTKSVTTTPPEPERTGHRIKLR